MILHVAKESNPVAIEKKTTAEPPPASTPAAATVPAAPAAPATTSASRRASPPSAELGVWTSDHDNCLLQLRDTLGKRWIDIVLTLGRPKDVLIQRYGELKIHQPLKNVSCGSDNVDIAATAAAEIDEDSWSATDPTDYVNDGVEDAPVLGVEDEDLTLREVCDEYSKNREQDSLKEIDKRAEQQC